ncbi:hypothetical protein [Bradyrhizobium sp. ORS 111]|uniref:hypothetical protein n=1 Tax=Bradyrhizobium sp. ORS 111 TaxID=1685958 RepID=UPI00389073CF
MKLAARLARLEDATRRGKRGLFVVSGHSNAEHQQKIDALVASGRADPDGLFVCLMKFGYENEAA